MFFYFALAQVAVSARLIPFTIDWCDRLQTNGTIFDSNGVAVRDTLLTIGPMSGGARIAGERVEDGYLQLAENFTLPHNSLFFSVNGPGISVLSAGAGSQIRTSSNSLSAVKHYANDAGYLIPSLC